MGPKRRQKKSQRVSKSPASPAHSPALTGRRIASPELIAGLLVFVGSLAVYVAGLAPSITWRNTGADSGDLATAVATWGVPHPTGYPTYVLLGRLFSLLPVGDLAYRLNVMSAVAGAGAVAGTYAGALCLVRLVRGKAASHGREYLAAIVAALAVAVAPVVWSQAVIGEVYALDAFFVASVAALVLWWLLDLTRCPLSVDGEGVDRRRRDGGEVSTPASQHNLGTVPLQVGSGFRATGKLGLAALLFGLGLGEHITSAAITAPLLLVGATAVRERRLRTWGLMLLAALIGASAYAYLPLAARGDPPIAWGDPRSWSGFLWVVTGRLYHHYVFGVPAGDIGGRATSWAGLMIGQFSAGVLLAAAGAWLTIRITAFLGAALIFGFLATVVFGALYNTQDSFVFLIPSLIVAGMWLAVASDALLDLTLSWLGNPRWGVLAATAVLVALVPGVVAAKGYPTSSNLGVPLTLNLRSDTEARRYAREAVTAMGPDAVVIGHSDEPLFALWYQRYVVVQPGSSVAVIGRNFVQYDWYLRALRRDQPGLLPDTLPREFGDILRAIVDYNTPRRPVYFTFRDPFLPEYELQQEGPVWRVVGRKGPPSPPP